MANNIMIVRHRLLTELIKLWKNEKLTTEDIDRLPLKLSQESVANNHNIVSHNVIKVSYSMSQR